MKLSDVQQVAEPVARQTADAASYGLAVGTLLGFLPEVAAGFSIIWISYQLINAENNKRNTKKKDK